MSANNNASQWAAYHADSEVLWSQVHTDTCRQHTCHCRCMSGPHTVCVERHTPDPSSRHGRHTDLHGSRRYRHITTDRRLTTCTRSYTTTVPLHLTAW